MTCFICKVINNIRKTAASNFQSRFHPANNTGRTCGGSYNTTDERTDSAQNSYQANRRQSLKNAFNRLHDQGTRPTLSQFWNFKSRRTMFLNYINCADLLRVLVGCCLISPVPGQRLLGFKALTSLF